MADGNGMVLRLAKVLAYQRLADLRETVPHDGTREGYWETLSEQTRELMLLRAQSALLVALDPEEFKREFALVAQYQFRALTGQTMTAEQSESIADAFVTQIARRVQGVSGG